MYSYYKILAIFPVLYNISLYISFVPFSCDLMTIFSVMFGLLCVCIYYRFLVYGYLDVSIQQYISIYLHDCFKLLISSFQMHFKNPAFVLPTNYVYRFLNHILHLIILYTL